MLGSKGQALSGAVYMMKNRAVRNTTEEDI